MKKKSIRYLIESELEKAQIVLAAKSIVDELQTLAEKINKLNIEDLSSVLEGIKASIGLQEAEQFKNTVGEALNSALNAVQEAKDIIDTEALKLSGDVRADDQISTPDVPAPDESGVEDFDDADMDVPVREPVGRQLRSESAKNKAKGTRLYEYTVKSVNGKLVTKVLTEGAAASWMHKNNKKIDSLVSKRRVSQ